LRCSAEFVFLLMASCLFAPSTANSQLTPENRQPHPVHGIVINGITREPIGRALVCSPDSRFATMTDSQGRFEFPDSSPDSPRELQGAGNSSSSYSEASGSVVTSNGPTVLLARKPGFLTDQNQEFEKVQAGEITLSLVPEALIVGRVVLSYSDGVTPIQLQLYKRQVQEGRAHWVSVADTTSRANGEFRFAELSPGTYKLFTLELLDRDPETFRPGGPLYGYPPVYFPSANSFAAASTIHLSAGKTFHADLSPVRQRYYPVKVPVANAASGLPISINVMVQGHRGPGFSLGYNDRDHTIEGMLPNGTYTLEATGFGMPAAHGLATIAVHDAPVEGPAMMLVANPSIPVSVQWEFTGTQNRGISARLAQGAQYVNVRLEPTEDFGQAPPIYLRPPTREKNNSLAFDAIPPGRYWVHVYPAPGFPSAVSSGGIDLLHHALTVTEGSSAPIEITMRNEAAEIDGTVEGFSNVLEKTQGGNESASGSADSVPYHSLPYVYCIPLPDGNGQFAQTPVGRDGHFNLIDVAPGTYRLLVFPRQQPELEYENPETMKSYESKGIVVRVVAGQKEHVRIPMISPSEQ
jgi:hypothetical protein